MGEKTDQGSKNFWLNREDNTKNFHIADKLEREKKYFAPPPNNTSVHSMSHMYTMEAKRFATLSRQNVFERLTKCPSSVPQSAYIVKRGDLHSSHDQARLQLPVECSKRDF